MKKVVVQFLSCLAMLVASNFASATLIVDLTGNGGALGASASFAPGISVSAVTRATSFADPAVFADLNQNADGLGITGGGSNDIDNSVRFAELFSIMLALPGRITGVEVTGLGAGEFVLLGASASANISFPLDFFRVEPGDDLAEPQFFDLQGFHQPGRFLHVGINQALGPNPVPLSAMRLSALHIEVPEPAATGLLLTGLLFAGLALRNRRSEKNRAFLTS